MGEFEFIEAVRRAFAGVGCGEIFGIGGGNGRGELSGAYAPDRPIRSAADGERIFGIGDDCAVLPLPGGAEAMVVTTDMLVEGVHFLRPTGSPRELAEARELGAKALAVNLSDVAAMGARPVASFLSLSLPAECRGGGNAHGGWATAFMDGYRQMSERHGVKLAGGDTTGSLSGVAINVVAIGRAPLSHLKYRSGARPGDIVAVCGPLGESAAGLADILAGRHDTPHARAHRNPIPQVAEGQWLGARAEVRSMIDLSDGLASDLVHVLRASGVAGQIELTAIPTPVEVEQAVTGGEDYKLLVTVDPAAWERLAADYLAKFATPLHPVGRIVEAATTTPDAAKIQWLEGGRPVTKNWRGFTHF